MANRLRQMWDDPKQRVAMSSVLAAIFLVVFKFYVGWVTNSLGILSEALHSGLDFVAAAITMVAVVSSAKPADEDHPFGHGKVENFSALVETLLLLFTCVWIVWEALERLLYGGEEIEASWAAFLVMGVSIVIDISRSRALYKAAREHKSQALEADALHFSTDIWSSAVVIVGLVCVRLSSILDEEWLVNADAVAALGVAMIVVVVSLRLGKRTMDHLMDKAPEGKIDQIRKRIEEVEGMRCERVRARTSGPYAFVDVRVSLDSHMPLALSEEMIRQVEAKVRDVMDGADVMVQIEPRDRPEEDLASRIALEAMKIKGIRGAHQIDIHTIGGQISVSLHLEVDPKMTVREAHDLADRLEESAKANLGIKEIHTHIETQDCAPASTVDLTRSQTDLVNKVRDIVARHTRVRECRDIQVRKEDGKLAINLDCTLAEDETLDRAHDLSTMIEREIRRETGVDHITIHIEPAAPAAK